MGEALRQYKTLLFTLITNTFSLKKRKNLRVNLRGDVKKGLGTGATVTLIAIGALCFLLVIISNAVRLTLAALNSGAVEELQYAYIAVAQIAVLFFGIATLMTNLYFAKDNNLLSALPFKNGVVFAAKFSLTYLGELIFAALIYLPLMITSGIVLTLNGYPISWSYFLIGILCVLIIPAVPLLLATFISQPLMLIASRLKRKSMANSIVMGIVYIVFFILYFSFIMSVSSIGEEGEISGNVLGMFSAMKKVTIFNYPLVEALFGKHSVVNLLIYLLGVIIVLAISVAMSLFFYKKTLLRSGEGESAPKKRVKEQNITAMPFLKSFIKKDVNVILHTPVLLINVLTVVVLPSILLFFFGFIEFEDGMSAGLLSSVLSTYLVTLIMCVGNPMANIGISLEGKNFYMLKSLPLNPKELVKAKFTLASLITAVASVIVLIVFPIASGVRSAVAIVGLPLQAFISGMAYNAMGLYNDLKKPNLKWISLNEITRNNVRGLKSVIVFLLLSFGYLIFGIFVAVIGGMLSVNEHLLFAVFYLICSIAPTIMLLVYSKKLSNAEELFRKIGD